MTILGPIYETLGMLKKQEIQLKSERPIHSGNSSEIVWTVLKCGAGGEWRRRNEIVTNKKERHWTRQPSINKILKRLKKGFT